MIETILPATVAVESSVRDHEPVRLFPEEEAVVARSVDKRRREFGTVRHCARGAMAALGVAAVPLVPGERGAPTWPRGIVGSMTHCAGYRAAAVARNHDVRTIGIDAEPHEALPEGILEAVALPEEREHCAELTATEAAARVHWDRLLFSAKESVYKAWFPLTRQWLDFSQASLVFHRDRASESVWGTFTARLLVEPPDVPGEPLTGFTGRWRVEDGLALTAICVPAR